jgi:hypothetical protein
MSLQDIKAGLRTYLLADSTISTAVGGSRIYSMLVPQGQTSPSIVFTKISGQGDHHMQGPSGLTRPRVQIDCYALNLAEAGNLALRVKERLDGFRGDMPYGSNSPPTALDVMLVQFDSEREFFEDNTKFFRVSQDYLIWYREF